MRIEYKNKFTDILLFNAIHQFLSPVIQGLFIICCAFIFLSESNENTISIASINTLLWFIFFWIFQFTFLSIYLFSRKDKNVLTNHVIEVQEDSFFEETKYNKSFFFWNGVIKVVSRPGFVAVYVSSNMAHVIPNRAFPSKEKRAEFINLVREKIHVSPGKV